MLLRLGRLKYDEAGAAALESQVEVETAEVARCQEHVDALSSKLTGVLHTFLSPVPRSYSNVHRWGYSSQPHSSQCLTVHTAWKWFWWLALAGIFTPIHQGASRPAMLSNSTHLMQKGEANLMLHCGTKLIA